MKRRIRRWIARAFLEIVLRPARWHAWLDRGLDRAHIANINMWSKMGVRMLTVYEWLYGEYDEDLGERPPETN